MHKVYTLGIESLIYLQMTGICVVFDTNQHQLFPKMYHVVLGPEFNQSNSVKCPFANCQEKLKMSLDGTFPRHDTC